GRKRTYTCFQDRSVECPGRTNPSSMSSIFAKAHLDSIARDHRREPAWLLSRTADFWFVCAGGGLLLILLAVALQSFGDQELSAADILLGELHLGATYDAIVRRRLWRMRCDVIVVPLCILAATYALMYGGYQVWVTTA